MKTKTIKLTESEITFISELIENQYELLNEMQDDLIEQEGLLVSIDKKLTGDQFRCSICDELKTRGVWRKVKGTNCKICTKCGKGRKK